MGQKLVINEKLYKSLQKESNLLILQLNGFSSVDEFFNAIVSKLNDEYNFLELDGFRFFYSSEESADFSQYSGFIDGDDLLFEKIIVFFTPLSSKIGNVIIEQSLMPTICKQMEKNIGFLNDIKYKKIVVLTSKINGDNVVSVKYNKLQMDVNSLNTLNFDVIPFFPIKNLSTDTKFNTLTEYLDMSKFLQKKGKSNAQIEYLKVQDDTLLGDCELRQLEGEFPKSFCFRFLTAIFAGGNDFKYDISKIIAKRANLDNQFANLKRFIDYANRSLLFSARSIISNNEDTIECDDVLDNLDDIHRMPEKGVDSKGRKRFKTQKKIRDKVLENTNYICDCNDSKHFYFESVDLHNYVEGHHIIPMNRQEEFYFDKQINLDNIYNIIPLCPTCHSQIHLGSRLARIKIISEIYIRNKAKLLALSPDITLSVLASYYNIGLTEEEEKDWLNRAEVVVTNKANKRL